MLLQYLWLKKNILLQNAWKCYMAKYVTSHSYILAINNASHLYNSNRHDVYNKHTFQYRQWHIGNMMSERAEHAKNNQKQMLV